MNTETKYPELFLKAVKHVLAAEGGYVNDPNDAGGETNYGISKRQYPHLNIKKLTIEDAIQIYYHDYWLQGCHKLADAYACFLFDSLVNHRPKTAIKFLQMSFKVSADGILGPISISVINRLKDNHEHTKSMIALCLAYRADFYHDLAVENPTQERFMMGWLRRLFILQQFINIEVNHGSD